MSQRVLVMSVVSFCACSESAFVTLTGVRTVSFDSVQPTFGDIYHIRCVSEDIEELLSRASPTRDDNLTIVVGWFYF